MSEEKVLTGEIVESSTALATQNNNQVSMFADEGFDLMVDLTTAKNQYCTFEPKNDEEKAKLFNATNSPDERIADCINKTINMKNVFIEVVECVKKETGEIQTCPRIVILDENMKSYQCVSIGIYSAIKKIFTSFGLPHTWEKPIKVEVKQVTKGDRKMLTLGIASK